jgi:glycosyltransferase involved in cell wall biosynthesis
MTGAERSGASATDADERGLITRHTDASLVDSVRTLFDDGYYRMGSGFASASRYEALEHYFEIGWHERFDPHPLFDTHYYLETHKQLAASGDNPLLHYLSEGAAADADPSPYFDTDFYYSQLDYYYSQLGTPARHAVNALVHYVEYGPLGKACNPNPLFDNGYYLSLHDDVRSRGENPLAHFLQRGRLEGRPASPTHAELMEVLGGRHLLRGRWRSGNVVFFLQGSAGVDTALAARDTLADEHHVDGRIVLLRRPPGLLGEELPREAVVLEDYERSADVLRSSALRLLALALTSESSRFAIGDVIELLAGARAVGVPVYFLVLDEETTGADLDYAADLATRVVFGSRELFQRVAGATGPYPANIVVRPFEREAVTALVPSTLELAARDCPANDVTAPSRRRSGGETRKVVVPCSDWSVSGVNSALETIGQELIGRGWDIEILFTRNRAYIEASVGAGRRLPGLPHRWLPPHSAGIDAMWETLIAEIQTEAPSIVFTAYDFYGNSVASALTNDIGVVMWAQADDGDYYEQTYRLGRYCNAIVCVSNRIREQVTAIHPGIAERAHVIHNTSIAAADVLPREQRRCDKLRIVYTGRLVQYQKRVLDFVTLADELEALGVDFTIDLVGDAPPAHDEASLLLPQRAARHLERGQMRMLGRLSRAEVLDELRASDLFVLLSDFEGLPLSLIEAMAAGCVPVVAEMESGISEVLVPDESGVIVHGRNYAQWARTIRDLWHDEVRLAAMADRAQQTVCASFTVERIVEQFDALLRGVAEEIANGYERPPALTWGARRAPFGDVLPPPTMYGAVPLPGLG